MRRKWILIALSAGLLAAAITGGVALAWGGPGNGWGRGDSDSKLSALAGKVAGILGTDEQETADAITQARQELRDEAQEAALLDFTGRVAEKLDTDSEVTADAIKQVAEEMRSEALETKLQEAIDSGDMTEAEAQEIRDKFASGGWRAKGFGFKSDDDAEDFANRVGTILEVEGSDVADAVEQAMAAIRSEAIEARLQAAVDSGKITEDEADEIREKIESGDWDGFGKGGGGHHGGKGHGGHGRRGRGHHGGEESGDESDSTSTTDSDGDNT